MSNPFLGCGLAPLGLSLTGYGVVAGADEPKRQDLIISSGSLAGSLGDCRLIDPNTRDYAVNAQGYGVGGSSVPQAVMLAMLTIKGSSAVQSLGQSFSNTKVISNNLLQNIASQIQSALQFLITNNKVKIDDISTIRDVNNLIRVKLLWTDISTGTNFTNIL